VTSSPRLARDGAARIIHLGDGPNLVNDEFLARFESVLDEVQTESTGDPVVITAAGKFFSNGFDLDFLGSRHGRVLGEFIDRSCRLLARILVFPAPTVAAINGHAFGIGAMAALACDQQVMRSDRGWICLPEVDLGLSFAPLMQALITQRLPARSAAQAMLTGRRYNGPEALSAGIVDAVAGDTELVSCAVERATPWAGKSPEVVGRIKADLYAPIIVRH